ncbi:MAG: helix-turn-helix transcriptional regulator [Christensenella sp.]|nr:helix-turn-helix transcriptional regulator [Christensenella sp.]
MFWETFKNLCAAVGLSPNAVAKKMGLSSAIVTYWSRGTAPSIDSLNKVAEFFNVSIDYLTGKEETPTSDYVPSSTLEARSLIDDVELLHKNPELRVLLSASSKLTKADVAAITEIALRMNREREDE